MVLDAGKIREFDAPEKLLADRKSAFYGMAVDAGLVE
jgi:ABC-type multidrug transport system fused ATPase/permease subunit